jgi:hypothetical protein
MKSSPHYKKQEKISKEQFLIAWTLARASIVNNNPSPTGVVRCANEAWKEIQKLKDEK